jgi:hypothetical protein
LKPYFAFAFPPGYAVPILYDNRVVELRSLPDNIAGLVGKEHVGPAIEQTQADAAPAPFVEKGNPAPLIFQEKVDPHIASVVQKPKARPVLF